MGPNVDGMLVHWLAGGGVGPGFWGLSVCCWDPSAWTHHQSTRYAAVS